MRRARNTLSLRSIVPVVTLLTVLATAALIHFPWHYTSRANVEKTVQALNLQIIEGITQEVRGILHSAASALQAVRTMLFQGVIEASHPAKREFLFLAELQSHPSISWVSFGWPNGNSFGAHKVEDDYIQMVETMWDEDAGNALRRIDHYSVGFGDIWFERREFQDAGLPAPAQPWYNAAGEDETYGWTDVYTLPVSGKAGISVATRLVIAEEFIGVIAVSIALERLSQYLQSLRVGMTGTVFIINDRGELIASQDPVMNRAAIEGQSPHLHRLSDGAYPFLRIVDAALDAQDLDVRSVNGVQEFMQRDADTGEDYFVTFAPLGHEGWRVATVIPAADFLETINRSIERLLLAIAFLTITIGIAAVLLSHATIVAPLSNIAAELRHIEAFELGKTHLVPSRIREIELLSSAMVRMTHGLAAFQKYLPTALVRTLIAEGIESKPQSRVATILFTDIEGFTAIAETMAPEKLVTLLNEYFSAVTEPIERHGGVITQFQGDAILTVFNVPTDDPHHAANAARAALAIQDVLRERIFAGNITIKARVGINTGDVFAGSVGSRDRVNYTVHGDAVNLAARLEALNKEYGTRILVSQSTADLIAAAFSVRRIGTLAVRGKSTSTTIFELAATKGTPKQGA